MDQVPLQHRIVLSAEGDYDGRVFRALALVDRRCVGKHELVEFAEAVRDIAAVV
jgi:hypothetical protein